MLNLMNHDSMHSNGATVTNLSCSVACDLVFWLLLAIKQRASEGAALEDFPVGVSCLLAGGRGEASGNWFLQQGAGKAPTAL